MTISVIVCAHNEERFIASCLHSLLAQSRRPDEIVLINNASTDRTGPVAAAIPGVRVVDEPRKGLVVARERGRHEARGQLLVYVDADCRAPLTWLERVAARFETDDTLIALSGNYRFYDWDWWGRTLLRAYDFTLGPATHVLVKYILRIGVVFYGGNFAVRRSALDGIGGFDTSIEFHGEDTNLGRRLSRVGNVDLRYDCYLYTSARSVTWLGHSASRGECMKLDTHVHTTHSGAATVFPFNHFMRESYNTPESVLATATRRGMDLITVTDHDEISGALALLDAGRDNVIVGCEVTAEWPDIDLCVHLNVLDITPAQHDEIQRRRRDVRELMPYLQQQDIYTSLNHVASGINGPLTSAHLAAVLPWVQGLEVINGTRQPSQNRTAMCLARATGKHTLGGGDSHTGRGIGLTWTEVPGAATREEFMTGLRAGRGIAGGAHGGVRTMMSDMWRFSGNFMTEALASTAERPADWRGYARTFGGILGLPVIPVLMAAPFVHFIHEQRFNRDLMFDLIARPDVAARLTPSLAA